MLINFIPATALLCLLLFTLNPPANAQSGHQIQLGVDVLPGDDITSARVQVVNRFSLSPQFSVGAGAGFTYYNDPLSLIPVFVDLQYTLTRTPPALFFFLRAGYNFSTITNTDIRVDSHHGGLMLNPGIGLQMGNQSGIQWHLTVGYSVDHSQFKVQQGDSRTIETDITYKRLTAGVGLSF